MTMKGEKQARHTEGPWDRNIKPAHKYPTIFAGRNTHVAQVIFSSKMTEDELEANCNLISAAPCLLAAAQAVLAEFDGDDAFSTIDALRAAIAKATQEDK